jgi:hypothetical protein
VKVGEETPKYSVDLVLFYSAEQALDLFNVNSKLFTQICSIIRQMLDLKSTQPE